MKITINNFEEAFKPYLGLNTACDNGYNQTKQIKGFYGKAGMEAITHSIDLWLENANGLIAEVGEKKPKKNRKYSKGKKGKVTYKGPKSKKPKAKKKNSGTKTPKAPKAPKTPSRPKKSDDCIFAEKPFWYTFIESYVKSFEGKRGKQTWRVRAFVRSINDHCTAANPTATPEITVIRQIRDELIKIANNHRSDPKVDIPKNDSLVKSCKEALKRYSISKKKDKEDLKAIALSGLCSNTSIKKTW